MIVDRNDGRHYLVDHIRHIGYHGCHGVRLLDACRLCRLRFRTGLHFTGGCCNRIVCLELAGLLRVRLPVHPGHSLNYIEAKSCKNTEEQSQRYARCRFLKEIHSVSRLFFFRGLRLFLIDLRVIIRVSVSVMICACAAAIGRCTARLVRVVVLIGVALRPHLAVGCSLRAALIGVVRITVRTISCLRALMVRAALITACSL